MTAPPIATNVSMAKEINDSDLIDQFRIKGKVAVVTGASRGIGEGIAIGLADAGAHVIITAETMNDSKRWRKVLRKETEIAALLSATSQKKRPFIV